ncbi:UNVERIFIED_CONTAM: Aldehyde oxidase GLOX [Sesamum latifolium]|uniref:Aldehyde oxidase GLOX n=1 Tax=Sesamum latifolium TaxID=2727402 RepID=A0AAW2VWP7_9LAMI
MATTPTLLISSLLHHLIILLLLLPYHHNTLTLAAGQWKLLLANTGVSAMHMQLLNTDRVVIFDLTDFGPSNISLPNGKCRNNPKDLTLKIDCTAHSVEYDVASNSVRPLNVFTNVWCSSGAAMPDGSLVETGGFNDGDRNARVFKPCRDNSCDWQEFNTVLTKARWYASNHILPDGRQIIIGGRGQFTYEFYPKRTGADASYNLPFLSQTNDPRIENNLYPFVFLNVDGNLFIFANNRAILFDYVKGAVVKTYPTIPGGDPRSYPSSGSAVLLPLRNLQGGDNRPEPTMVMETMPSARVMGDMVLLPNGNVLIINGASEGTAGWDLGRNPVLTPVVYRPNNPVGSRFEAQLSSSIPRMYHSTAVLLRDGRVLVSGSNPNAYYNFTGVLFPTDLTMEAFSPDYLDPRLARERPTIVTLSHSQSGNDTRAEVTPLGRSNYQVRVMTPGSNILAPPGYYLLFVVYREVPSQGIWVQIK